MSNAVLWQVVSPQGISSFLLGTMHVRDLHAFRDIDKIKRCIDFTEVYFSEIEMAPTSVGAGIDKISQFQRLPDGRSLLSYISENKYHRLRNSILKAFGLDIDYFKGLYPLIISNIIQTSILNNTSDIILDFYLYQYANDKGKTLKYLESQEEQLSFFRDIPMNYQIKSLLQLGRQPSRAKKQINSLVTDYAQKNTRNLYQRSKNQLGKLRPLLLYQRNEKMARVLIEDLQNTSAFVGVGAAHLFGYKGILRLMKKEGYKIIPVS